MRYQQNTPVEAVLAWLKEKGVELTRRSYQRFIARVLHLMPLDQAKGLGVNGDLLRAVRVRYKLPVDPKRVGRLTGKPAPRHDSRVRRRRILPEREAKRPAPTPPARPPQREVVDGAQYPLPGIGAAPLAPSGQPVMRGTPDNPVGYGDWKIVNDSARRKLSRINRHIYTNLQGRGVVNIKTQQEYSLEDLVALFELTATEAQSCYMSFGS